MDQSRVLDRVWFIYLPDRIFQTQTQTQNHEDLGDLFPVSMKTLIILLFIYCD